MAKRKNGPTNTGASPKVREIASQDATADDGSLDTVPGATSGGVVDGVAGTGGSSGSGATKAEVTQSGEISGIEGVDETDDLESEDDGGHGTAAAERSGMRANIKHPNRNSSDDTDANEKGRGKSSMHG